MPERAFLIFLQFFWEFFSPGRERTEYGSKFFFFFRFFCLCHPVLAINSDRKRFFNFLNFLAIFFGIFLPRSSMSRIWDYNFFFPFLGLSNLILPRNNAIKRFFNFLNFFLIFFRIFLPGSSMNGIRD